MNKLTNLAITMDEKPVKNTDFDNLVNYPTHSSSGSMYSDPFQSTSNPTSLSFLIKNNQIAYYTLATVVDKETVIDKEIE